jgi:hypothetical protein
MQEFFSLLSWRLFTAQHVSGVYPPMIRSSMTAVVGPANRPPRPRIQYDCHHDKKVKSEAATAVIELLMMGGKTLETCWAVNKRQENKLENCCIWLVIFKNLFDVTCSYNKTIFFAWPFVHFCSFFYLCFSLLSLEIVWPPNQIGQQTRYSLTITDLSKSTN